MAISTQNMESGYRYFMQPPLEDNLGYKKGVAPTCVDSDFIPRSDLRSHIVHMLLNRFHIASKRGCISSSSDIMAQQTFQDLMQSVSLLSKN